MYENLDFKALVCVKNVAKASTATSNKTIMTTISISKDIHLITIMVMVPTHETRWKNIHSLNRLSDILHVQLGLHPVDNIVTDMSNAVPTETAAAYEEARTVSKVAEGAATKAEYLDGIGFMNGKINPMTAFTKVA